MAVIGIDFGTEFSSVAATLQDGHVHSLPDELGKIRISSCVSFLEDEIRIGNLADLKREDNLKNTVYDLKLLLGQTYKNAITLQEKYKWPFTLAQSEDGKVLIEVEYLKKPQQFYPEEIVSMLFLHLVEIAKKRLQPNIVSAAVITVPTLFNHSQRKSVLDAACIANIEVKALLNETTAAAVYYSCLSSKHKESTQRLLIIHVGSASFAVSVCHLLCTDISEVKVEYNDGDFLGGKDVNIKIFHHISERARKSFNSSSCSYPSLHKIIERMKKEFSAPHKRKCMVEIQDERAKQGIKVEMKREEFNEACHLLQDPLGSVVKQLLQNGSTSLSKINKVLLIGGSTRLPLLNDILNTSQLDAKLEKASVKTDEIVVLGAGIFACTNFMQNKCMVHIREVLTYSVADTDKVVLARKNTPLDGNMSKISCNFHSSTERQLLDQLGNVQISATSPIRWSSFNFTRDGMISGFGKDADGIINDGLPKEMIIKLAKRQHQLREGHAEREILEEERYFLEKEVWNAQKTSKKLLKDCQELVEWVENNPNSSLDKVRLKKKKLNEILHPFSKIEEVNPAQNNRLHELEKQMKHEFLQKDRFIQAQNNKLHELEKQMKHELLQKDRFIQAQNNKLHELERQMKHELLQKDRSIEDLKESLASKSDFKTREEYESLGAKLDAYICIKCESLTEMRKSLLSELNMAKCESNDLKQQLTEQKVNLEKIEIRVDELLQENADRKSYAESLLKENMELRDEMEELKKKLTLYEKESPQTVMGRSSTKASKPGRAERQSTRKVGLTSELERGKHHLPKSTSPAASGCKNYRRGSEERTGCMCLKKPWR